MRCLRGVPDHPDSRGGHRTRCSSAEQIADDVPMLPLLDSPVPQMVDQLVAVLARYDMPLADQVIEVPKVSYPPRFGRTVLCTPQTAEQLVTVPTTLYFLKQTVDTRGRSGDPQRFLPEQSSPSTVGQIIDIPAPGRGVQRGLQGFSQERVQQRLVEQNIVFQQRLPSRTLTFQFPEVACTVSLFLALQAHP